MVIDGESWEKLQNDVEIIKNRVSSLDRIAAIESRETIIRDIQDVVGRSRIKAAILYLTREEISREELSEALGIDARNLSKFMNPLAGIKGYVNVLRRSGRVAYRRDEKLDLLGFDELDEFRVLLEEWRAIRGEM